VVKWGVKGGGSLKLDLDCVRDILLCVEENTGVRNRCVFVDTAISEDLRSAGVRILEPKNYQRGMVDEYGIDAVMYHVKYCCDADLISIHKIRAPYDAYTVCVDDLTPKGHDFLANIRDNKIWDGVKAVAGKVGSKSLEAVTQIAANVITELIKRQFGL